MVFRWMMRSWIRFALWLRFRKIQLVFHAPVPVDHGVILAGNHQNSLLDSITMAARSPRVPFTLSRGSLFNTPLGRWLLRPLRMLPIYRFRDGFRKMRENPEVFAQFVEVLDDAGWLSIFPEGSHFIGHTLRPLQRGAARIAFAGHNEGGWQREISIVPVGFQYESHTDFGSRLLIQYGPPISTLGYREEYEENPKGAERALTAKLFEEIAKLVLILPEEEAEYSRALRVLEGNQGRYPDLMEQFRADEKLLLTLKDQGRAVAPEAGSGVQRSAVQKVLGYLASLPALVLHLPLLLVLLIWEKLFFDDAHLAPGARFTLGMFLTTFWYIGALVAFHLMVGSWPGTLALALAMPASLWLRSRTWHWVTLQG